MSTVQPVVSGTPTSLLEQYRSTRACTLAFSDLLSVEDQGLQSMPDASPTKWHLAHTTWFFETFVLSEHRPGYRVFDDGYRYLFNSYYNAVGGQYPRPQRGLISRPGLAEVRDYRAHVDAAVESLASDPGLDPRVADLIALGCHHEQQHQELAVTDIKHALWHSPSYPVVVALDPATSGPAAPTEWLAIPQGIREVGHGGEGFAFDNERPRHKVFLDPFELATRPVSNGEYLEFIADRGYDEPALWLSDGWAWRQRHGVDAPLYWRNRNGTFVQYTLGGLRPVDPAEPVCHLSYYEADAFARWRGARLPTEAEWEVAFSTLTTQDGDYLTLSRLHPRRLTESRQVVGGVWEWTASAYCGYPGFKPAPGAVGEYNGKFMANQMVLRGGSCATPPGHLRMTYRNFFPPEARWQFTGLRLAR